jgi:cation diffusion facilitator CzcD-associated flavoprotein CzcO
MLFTRRQPRVAIVGAGMSGLCMGIKLEEAGIHDFTIYEKAGEVGGTWRENTYPGLTCDVPSRFYQYSFAPNPDWSHVFSAGPEIQRYFRAVCDRYDLRRHIAFGKEVVAARFDGGEWRIRTADGDESSVDFLITATGVLHRPRYPDLPGLETFSGAAFHSARWDHDVPLRDARIGVIGTGSTAVQISSELADVAGKLVIFQRTAQWVLPLNNRRYSRPNRAATRRLPALSRFSYRYYRWTFELFAKALLAPGWQRSFVSWVCRQYLRTVRDPELRRKLTPDYQPMCKRLVVSSRFYRAVQRPNVDVVTEPIERVEPRGVVTGDGALHELDVLVMATGFDAHAYVRPMAVEGEAGLTLDEAWSDGPRAYRTVAMPGFPNLFMLIGPHSPVANFSLVPIAEAQADFALRWIAEWRAGRIESTAPTEAATTRFNEELRAAFPGTVWATGCQSWYLDKDGNPEVWPWAPGRHRELLEQHDAVDFSVRAAPPAAAETR